MKIRLLTTLLLPALVAWNAPAWPDDELAEVEVSIPVKPEDAETNWVDESHAYATDKAQALTDWMDNYFGDPNYDLEDADSVVRLDFITKWDQDDGNNNAIRLRGKLQLPRISRRLNLVFEDEQGDELDPEQRRLDDRFGLLYEVSETERSRVDLTMGITWNHLRPGIRYRYQTDLGEITNLYFTQRLQYDTSERFYTTSQVQLDWALSDRTMLRWYNGGVYGEETNGLEWISRLSLFDRKRVRKKHQLGINYFFAVNGDTDPRYIKNYRVGVLFRRQVYRKFLFLQLEPAYNYRKQNADDKRQFAWSIALGLQVVMERDLRTIKDKKQESEPDEDSTAAGEEQPLADIDPMIPVPFRAYDASAYERWDF